MSRFVLAEPTVEETPTPEPADYTSIYGNWSTYLASIATSLENIDDSLNTIEANSTLSKTALETIASNSTVTKEDITRLRDLADRTRDGLGIRTVQPYGEVSIAILWLLYMEKGRILDTDLASNEQLAENLARLNTILERIRANVSAEGSF